MILPVILRIILRAWFFGLVGVRIRDLPHGSPALYQMSLSVGGMRKKLNNLRPGLKPGFYMTVPIVLIVSKTIETIGATGTIVGFHTIASVV